VICPISVHAGTRDATRTRSVTAAAASAVSASPSRVASGPQPAQDVTIDPGQPLHALRAQPLDVVEIADRADPAPHRGQRPIELGGDPPVPIPRALASNADPMTAMVSARRTVTAAGNSTWVTRQERHRARRGRSASTVWPWSRTVRARA
jgi:hypothetical protein